MMGTRQFRSDLSDYFSNMDPSQFHFYDFGIQDFLVMKSHQNVVCIRHVLCGLGAGTCTLQVNDLSWQARKTFALPENT